MTSSPPVPNSCNVETLYREHHHWLQGWLRKRLGNTSDAADIAHDTYMRLLVSGTLPPALQARAYLTQIAKGLAINHYRRGIIEAAYLDALAQLPEALSPSPEERALALEALLLVDTALGTLPAKTREVFLLSQYEGLTYSAIADKMAISVGSVRKYMFAAMRACHTALQSST